MELQEILSLPVYTDYKGITELRDLIYEVNVMLFDDPEGFNGKRPWGNSGWVWEIYKTFVFVGLVDGKLDQDGCVEIIDIVKAKELLRSVIKQSLFPSPNIQ